MKYLVLTLFQDEKESAVSSTPFPFAPSFWPDSYDPKATLEACHEALYYRIKREYPLNEKTRLGRCLHDHKMCEARKTEVIRENLRMKTKERHHEARGRKRTYQEVKEEVPVVVMIYCCFFFDLYK